MAWVPSLITGGLSILGGERRNRMETRLANTAHQREALDLEKAGLNRILTATGGAGAPVPSLGNVAEGVGEAASSAYSSMRAKQERDILTRQRQLLEQQISKTSFETDLAWQDVQNRNKYLDAASASALESQNIANAINARAVPRAKIETDLWEKGKDIYDAIDEAARKLIGGPSGSNMRTGGKF